MVTDLLGWVAGMECPVAATSEAGMPRPNDSHLRWLAGPACRYVCVRGKRVSSPAKIPIKALKKYSLDTTERVEDDAFGKDLRQDFRR